jgi:hypothetical protein
VDVAADPPTCNVGSLAAVSAKFGAGMFSKIVALAAMPAEVPVTLTL